VVSNCLALALLSRGKVTTNIVLNLQQNKNKKHEMGAVKHCLVNILKSMRLIICCLHFGFGKDASPQVFLVFCKNIVKRYKCDKLFGDTFYCSDCYKIDLGLVLIVLLEKQVVSFVVDVVRNFGKLIEI